MTTQRTSVTRGNWTASSVLLLLFGLVLVVVGSYFLFVRPPLLPEDVRYLAASPADIDAAVPNLKAWLTHVFRVLGGHIVASGMLTVALAATSYREHRTTAAIAVTAAGAASIGLMTAVNFTIGSDFRWILLAIAVLWVSSIVMYAMECWRTFSTYQRLSNETSAKLPSEQVWAPLADGDA